MTSKKRPARKANERDVLGRPRPDGEALFPVAPRKSGLPNGYGHTLEELG